MNQQKLIQRLAELSGMARAIMIVSTDTPAETIADVMEDVLDDGRLRVMWQSIE